jgi:hypothetical protein
VLQPFDKTGLKQDLITWIDRRYEAHAARDLGDYVFANHLFYAATPAEVEFAYGMRGDILAYLDGDGALAEMAEYCALATKRYTYRRNQFINFTGAYDQELSAEYRRFLEHLRLTLAEAASPEGFNAAYAGVLQQHHQRLRLLLSAYCVDYAGEDLAGNPLLRSVPNEEYSAQFQLRLLALDPARLVEPVLDLGCGASGGLVNFLRSRGKAAFGLDRLAPAGPYFYRQDWFEFDVGRGSWGTLIAHHSFSTHFIYNHLHHPAAAEQYARLYMRLLAGLKPGGMLCYTPGLPFFEETLATTGRYVIDKTTIAANSSLGIGEIFYAVQVRFLAA